MTEHGDGFNIQTDNPDLIDYIIDFIQSRSYRQKEILLQEHPDLLSNSADHIFEQLVNQLHNAGNESQAEGISTWREFLRNVKDYSFEAAVLRSIIFEAFVRIVDQQQYIGDITRNHPELLSDDADDVIATIIREIKERGSPGVELFYSMAREIQEQRDRKRPVRDEALNSINLSRRTPRVVFDLLI